MGKCSICQKRPGGKKHEVYTGEYRRQLEQKVRTTYTGKTEITTKNLYGNFKSHTYHICGPCSFKHNFLVHLILLPFFILWVISLLPFLDIELYLQWGNLLQPAWVPLLILIGIMNLWVSIIVIKSRIIRNGTIIINWLFFILLWFPPDPIYFISQAGVLRVMHIIAQGFLSFAIPWIVYETQGINLYSHVKNLALRSRVESTPEQEFIALSVDQFRQLNR